MTIEDVTFPINSTSQLTAHVDLVQKTADLSVDFATFLYQASPQDLRDISEDLKKLADMIESGVVCQL